MAYISKYGPKVTEVAKKILASYGMDPAGPNYESSLHYESSLQQVEENVALNFGQYGLSQNDLYPSQTVTDTSGAAGVAPYTPGVPVNTFLQSQLEEQVNAALQQLSAWRSTQLGNLTQDYNRYVELSSEDKAKNLENTNIAYARAKERALGGYQDRGLYSSGIKVEGQKEVSTEQTSSIDAFNRAAERAAAEQKIQYGRATSEIERQYNESVASTKRSLASAAGSVVGAYA